MDEQEHQKNPAPKKRRSRTWIIVLITILFFFMVCFVVLFLGFNYYGDRLLRSYLQNKIIISSGGLYRADFKKLNVNILTGKVVLDSFELTPDTVQYQKLIAQGKIARALYQISIFSLTIDKVHFRQIYAGKRINFRQLTIQRPMLRIVGFPDTATAKRNKWKVVYEDLYPTVSGFFNDFHIDSVKVDHGLFLTSSTGKTGRQTTGEYEYSARLRDVSVNPFSYYNRERVFYSRDIDLVVHNFEYQLADSLYSLKANEIGFSLTQSILYGSKISLVPNIHSKNKRHLLTGDLFRINLPAFSIRGINLYRAMTDRKVEISAVNLTNFVMQIYSNKPTSGKVISRKSRKKITIAGLYSIIAKELRFVDVDSVTLKDGSFEFFRDIDDANPELRIRKANLELDHFRLDSITYLDRSRIFYSRSIELDLEKVSLVLRDGIHYINASAITFSTKKSLIDVHEVNIFPDRKKNVLLQANKHNTMLVHLPRLTFTGIDLKKVFNRRILDFNKLIINEPEIRYARFRESKNPDPRFKKPEDFFDEENEEVVYDLLKKYLWVVKGNGIQLKNGYLQFSLEQNGIAIPVASSYFNLSMQQFLIDSVHGMNEQGYFYSRDFDLDLNSLSVVSPDSLKNLKAGRVHINTKDSLIEANNISINKTGNPAKAGLHSFKKQSLTYEFSLQNLLLTGLNHKKLFLEKILKANQIVFDKPLLSLKTNLNPQEEELLKEAPLLKTEKFIRTFEIGRCLVRKGSFSYDGEEDRKASYFNLKDIEFTLVNSVIHIPDKGGHDGLIRFDSLQLRVVPLRAVIADSTYALEARSLEVHSYPANIIIQGIKITPLKSLIDKPGSKILATITIPEIRFKGFYFDRAIFDRKWLLDDIDLEHPSVFLEMYQDGKGDSKDEKPRMDNEKIGSRKFDPANLIKIPPLIKTIAVAKVSIANADIRLNIHRNNSTRSFSMKNMMFELTRFRVDSATRSNPAQVPLFNTDDISISAPGYSWTSPDSMYTYKVGRVKFSTGSASAFLDSITVAPNYSKTDFSRKLGYQTDRIVFQVPGIKISQIDFRKLISERQLQASSVRLLGMTLESYRDKRLPFPEWQRPLLPGKMVSRIKFPVNIDTIILVNGVASYEEQTGDEPGRIFFDRMNATLTGLNTISGKTTPKGSPNELELHATTRIMGIAPSEVWFDFQKDSPTDSFSVHGTIGDLYLPAINPMLSKLLPASIKNGIATSTKIISLNANDSIATGILDFRYTNLAIKFHPTKLGTWHLIEQSLLTEVINLILADSNPNDEGKMRYGVIYYARDKSKGFFNFVWKSVLSGIKSSVGVNTKTQKEIKKQLKRQKNEIKNNS